MITLLLSSVVIVIICGSRQVTCVAYAKCDFIIYVEAQQLWPVRIHDINGVCICQLWSSSKLNKSSILFWAVSLPNYLCCCYSSSFFSSKFLLPFSPCLFFSLSSYIHPTLRIERHLISKMMDDCIQCIYKHYDLYLYTPCFGAIQMAGNQPSISKVFWYRSRCLNQALAPMWRQRVRMRRDACIITASHFFFCYEEVDYKFHLR